LQKDIFLLFFIIRAWRILYNNIYLILLLLVLLLYAETVCVYVLYTYTTRLCPRYILPDKTSYIGERECELSRSQVCYNTTGTQQRAGAVV
jgi:hypothetical protein